jgi:hypothetical protein
MPRHRLRNCFQAHPLKFRVTFNNSDYCRKQAFALTIRLLVRWQFFTNYRFPIRIEAEAPR